MQALLALLLAPRRAEAVVPPPLLDTHCAIQDPYECTATAGCGFCMSSFTCMVGDEDGPAPGLLPCETLPRCQTKYLCGWASSAAALDAQVAANPEEVSFHLLRQPRFPCNGTSPPRWDTLCEGGGQRHWEELTTQPIKDYVRFWGSQRCDCPAGRSGYTCGGCANHSGCAGGAYGCWLPGLQPMVERTTPTRLGCVIRDAAKQVGPGAWGMMAEYLLGFGSEAEVRLALGPDEVFVELRKAVDYPQSSLSWYTGEGCKGLASRVLSSVSFSGKATGGNVQMGRETCPTGLPGDFEWPWAAGTPCMHWTITGSADDFFDNPKPADGDFHNANGWLRYDDGAITSANLQPPFELYCVDVKEGTADVACALLFPQKLIGDEELTISLYCQLEGECRSTAPSPPATTPGSPPSPPAFPPPPPSPAPPFCDLPANKDLCAQRDTYFALFTPPAVAALAFVLALLIAWQRPRCHIRSEKAFSVEPIRARRSSSPPEAQGAAAPSSAEIAMAPNGSTYDAPLAAAPSSSEACELRWEQLSYRVAKHALLHPCSGAVGPGLWCLLGPSGSGKSTLLAVLCGRKSRGVVRGAVCIHGEPVAPADRRIDVGYVTQDDVLPPTSTVEEHLMFHASLRCHWLELPYQRHLVYHTLQQVNLLPKAESYIGDGYMRGLSGGEKRRVSIAVELLVLQARQGGLLLLDEPLSGLDSASARRVLQVLVECTSTAACAALLSVHQPTARFMKAMAGCVVMAPGGRLLYCGATRAADGGCALAAHFDGGGVRLKEWSALPAEAVLELIDERRPDAMARVAELAARMAADARPSPPPPRAWRRRGRAAALWRALLALGARHARLMLRHPLLLTANTLSTLLASGLSAWAFMHVDSTFNNGVLQRTGFLFFVGAYFLFTALVSISMWREERVLYFQERGAGCYGPLSYVVSRTFFDALTLRILPALIFSAITYPIVGLDYRRHGAVKAYSFIAALCLANLVGSAMFNCIGIACSSTAVAVLVAVLYALFTLLFCGFLVNANALGNLRWVANLSFLHYFCELIMTNELSGQTFDIQKMWAGEKSWPHPKPVSGDMILTDTLGYFGGSCWRLVESTADDSGVTACWFDLYIPAIWFVVAVVVSFLLLQFVVRDPH
ncbi:hypothetical protein AB1Y20_006231 [Prymnesium parvum]|uniref:ABC transporter domain-containing protein n=1 Tax=Prymnesium parvum TaxID=97485 RepID=A0AB34J5D1_PRYPA